jgi:hypothetical protein
MPTRRPLCAVEDKRAMRVTMNCSQCDKTHEGKFVLARIILLGSGQEGGPEGPENIRRVLTAEGTASHACGEQ